MKNLLKTYFSKRFLPRWIILIFDLAVVSVTFLFAYMLRLNLDFIQINYFEETYHFLIILPLFTLIYYLIKPYSGVIRHSTLKDASSLFMAQSIGFTSLVGINL
ncbi:MAG: hypothetical protein HQ541_07350, partial [Mariniphaga sp.]|nr:hypothetical protein [Mariniphaga sp.]